MARLQEEYIKNIKPNLIKELGLKNIFAVPKVKKVVINMGLGIDANDKKKTRSCNTRTKTNFWPDASHYKNKKSYRKL